MPSPKSQEYDVMLPFGSVEDRPSKKTYQPGIGYCGWKSNEATGGEASGAAGDETGGSVVGLGKGPTSIAGVINGATTTRALKSIAKRPTCVRLRAIVSRLLDRRELRGAGGPPSSDPPDRPDRDGGRGNRGQNPRNLVRHETDEASGTGTFGRHGCERVDVHGGPVHLRRSGVRGGSRIEHPSAKAEGDDRHVSVRRRRPRRACGKVDGDA